MGGALAMNAGAFGGETWQHVVAVETIDRHGREHARPATSFKATYRHVEMPEPHEWFVGAKLVFEKKPGVHESQVRELLAKRKATQPIGEWSGGSTFTNPPNDHAARLIEVSGLKGKRIGDASVSQKHANFIINHGQAKAADIEGLITHVQETVEKLQGVRLNPEVRIVGKHGCA
jgi:UDP-N-acetylmuramate dehydrogenase